MIREEVQSAEENIVCFGKYKGWLYKEIPETYLSWAISEVGKNPNASEDLRRLANFGKAKAEKEAPVVSTRTQGIQRWTRWGRAQAVRMPPR